ncbi:[Pyruvate dehydrogenase (acetyl-transferring)] kinase 2, mitochondrial [Coemansia sp. RSA 1813]|nr:[Pyruvate dehydrogenase (acetyl-transferring)] kinase 2, mitochondrial [Coemansia sp. RSA 1646]KAJ1772044.1 [Pyruvate dehydrogenase (acetyl-transferring)] kinase 2, mitochondrial [Coemansia sp. RSA 1843]KAJ2090585.1 [Pyruvate dehydrogenase (acetyl-transferring)] kinase 2, mitochondrial [Coemansia sp. RSA 986]KAJ2216328.1 [Pyruvate dehydrogenase (acetyl-transferring)] kinase 2, mitochondrial [Coemansia sp. RSA 487]KAJ2570886.1 [Pyruvate dehydrogenase (acetyl-transferring)] kinase 2, mitochond
MSLYKVNSTTRASCLALRQVRRVPQHMESKRLIAAEYHQMAPTYATLRLKTTTAVASAPPVTEPTLAPHSPAPGHGRTLQQKFYENRILDRYTAQEPKKVTLRQLVLFGRQLTDDKLVASANYVRTELPVRLAHRISDFQFLPYIAGTNPHLRTVYDLYWRAFDEFRKFPVVKTLDDNRRFCDNVKKNLLEHSQVIPQLGMGVSECADLVAPEEIDRFMNQMLISRISRRTLAEQHIALSEQFDDDLRVHLGLLQSTEGFAQMRQAPKGFATQRIGIVRADCNAAQIVHECAHHVAGIYEDAYHLPPGTAPQVIVEGHTDATFMCIPAHFSYIVHELLKNAMAHVVRRFADTLDAAATVEEKGSTAQKHHRATDPVFPPIRVTICSSHSDIVVRVSDQGGGIGPDVLPYIWSFTHPLKAKRLHNFHAVHRMEARVDETDAVSPLMSFGFGLPMSRVYARYWGGSVSVHSLPGHGVDAYIQLPRLGNVVENISARRAHASSSP